MNGIWDALTTQGKLAVLGVVAAAVLVFALVYHNGSAQNGSGENNNSVAFIAHTPTLIPQRTGTPPAVSPTQGVSVQTSVTRTAVASATSAASTPTQAPTEPPAPTSTSAVVIVPPTSTTFIPPTQAPPPPPPPTSTVAAPPTATVAAVSCTTLSTVSNPTPNIGDPVTVTGTFTCNGAGVSGVTMSALFSFADKSATCSGVSDSQGRTSCTMVLREGVTPNTFVPVNVCFPYQGQSYCRATGFTPQ